MARIPESIGKYKIESLLAKGGMGAVFKGLHPTLKRPVILKKLTLRGRTAFVKRFEREARILMDFRNDNIVDMYDHFKEGTSYYLVLEYVDGISMDGLIERERYLPNDAALYIFLETAKALKYAHDKNVIHRDIKPANILLSNTGEVKLADFGIAVSGSEEDDGLTKEGMTLGTPSYMAPEQIDNSKNVDKRADIYSLGVMLYEMVSGKKPFAGNLAESLVMIHKGKYTPVRRHNPKTSGFVNRIIKKSMQVNADSRYQDLEQIITQVEGYFRKKDMDAFKEHFIEYIKSGSFKPAAKKGSFIGRLAGIILLSAVVFGGLAGFIGYKGYHYEVLFAESHGALIVSSRFEKMDMKAPEELYVKAFVYPPGGEETKQELFLYHNTEKESPVFWTFESEKVYLPGGRYIVEIYGEYKVLRELVFLDPRVIQREIPVSGVAKRIELTFTREDVPVLPLYFSYKVVDTFSGLDITDRAGLSVSWDGSQWGAFSSEYKLTTGRTYWFRVSAPGYQVKEDKIVVLPHQTVYDLQLGLVPQTGSAMLFSNYDDISYRINDSTRYITIEENSRVLKDLPVVSSSKVGDLVLFPGEYTISAAVGDARSEVVIQVQPGEEININLVYDKAEKQVDISW